MYFSSIWLGSFTSILHPVRVLQIIRIFANLIPSETCQEAYVRLKILPAAALRGFFSGVFMYNFVRGKPDAFLSVLTRVNEVHSHSTTSMNQIYVNNLITSRSGFSLIF